MIIKLKNLLVYIFLLLTTLATQTAYSKEDRILFREDFNNLKNWNPCYFPRVKKHTSYIIESNGNERYLKAISNASASAIEYRKEFNAYEFPRIKWQWKIENVYKNGNAKNKSGDDYPIRIFITFKYHPETAGFLEKLKYNSLKLIYGEYPPHSSLNYIWSSKEHKETIITSPYTKQCKMILLQKGNRNVNKWLTQDVNIIKDYQEAFGCQPPPLARIAIMNDSDDTGEESVSYIKDIQVYDSDEMKDENNTKK